MLRNFDGQHQSVVGADSHLDHTYADRISSFVMLDDLGADRVRLDARVSRRASVPVSRSAFVMLDDLNADRGRLRPLSRIARLDDSQVSQSQQSSEDIGGRSRESRLDDSQSSQPQGSQEIILSGV